MSLSATRLYRNRFTPQISLEQELTEMGLTLAAGRLECMDSNCYDINQHDVDSLRSMPERFYAILKGKSDGARWLADRVTQTDYDYDLKRHVYKKACGEFESP